MHTKVIGFIAVIIIAAGSIFWMSGHQKKEESSPIRIGTNPWPGYEFLHLADKKGFFKEEGVPVELVRFSALEDARRAYERGQVDGMASTLIELLQAHEHGRQAKIILMTDFSNGSDVILARKDITDIAGLKGKKIGVEAESLSVFVIARALEQAGLSLDDVHMESMSQLNMPEALLAGEIDALHTYPPYSTELMKHSEKVSKIFDSTQIPGEIVDIVSVDPDIADHRIDDMRAIRRAWDKAVAFASAHPEEANKIMAEVEGITPEDFAGALQGVKILTLPDQQSLMEHDGTLEHVLLKINEVLHRNKTEKVSITPDNFISHIEDSQP